MQGKWQTLWIDAKEAFGAVPNTRHSLPQTPIARCRKAMRDMAVRKAASALMNTEPAVLSSTETCLKMQELHPSPKIPPQVQLRGSLPIPENLTEADIRRALRSLSFQSAPGPDGLRPAIFKCLAHPPGGAESTSSALAELTVFCIKCVDGDLPSSMSPWFASAN